MPWLESSPMDQRMQFIVDYQRGLQSVTELAERFGISRKTAYKWIDRHEADEAAGLQDRSRRPRFCPHATPPAIVEAVLDARRHHPRWGAKKLLRILRRTKPETSWPSRTPVMLTVTASDDGVPAPPPPRARGNNPNVAVVDGVRLLTTRERPITQAIVKPSRQGLAVTWTHWRGPGTVTFDPMTMVVEGGKATTHATFSEPGTYVIRVYADDGILATPADVTIVVVGAPKTGG